MHRPFDVTAPPAIDTSRGGGGRVRLVCVEGGGPSALVEGDELRLGRHTDNDLVLPDDRVSRWHARIVRQPELGVARFLFEDLGSSNGSYVNSRRVQPRRPQRLRHLDVVQMGDLRYLFFDLGEGAAQSLDFQIDQAAVDAEVDRLLREYRIASVREPGGREGQGDDGGESTSVR
ncbi:MAG: FHA domain-containing protein [Planctomycetes bacterium]|nr:FHA domain-containing protein [Planctomycetota bacterium]